MSDCFARSGDSSHRGSKRHRAASTRQMGRFLAGPTAAWHRPGHVLLERRVRRVDCRRFSPRHLRRRRPHRKEPVLLQRSSAGYHPCSCSTSGAGTVRPASGNGTPQMAGAEGPGRQQIDRKLRALLSCRLPPSPARSWSSWRLRASGYIRASRNRCNRHRRETIGWQPKEVRRYHASFSKAQSWSKSRRVAAKVEGHPGERPCRVHPVTGSPGQKRVIAFSSRDTAEQYIKEGKNAINWTRLSCHGFRRVRVFSCTPWHTTWATSAHARLADGVGHWSLTTVREMDQDSEGRAPQPLHHFPDGRVAVSRGLFRKIRG